MCDVSEVGVSGGRVRPRASERGRSKRGQNGQSGEAFASCAERIDRGPSLVGEAARRFFIAIKLESDPETSLQALADAHGTTHGREKAANTQADPHCTCCGGGESTEGNEILLCDGLNCANNYHQRCCNPPVAAVPEGAWLCPSCVARGNEIDPEVDEDEQQRKDTEGGVDTMQQMFTDFNIDRKVGQGMEALRKAFDLPGDAVRLRKSRCALVSQLGAFYVTSYHLCFIGGLGKKLAVPFSELAKCAKAKRFKMSPGHGHAIHLTTKDGTVHQFNAFTDRDEVFKAIAQQAKTVAANVVFEE